jgi:hypothetical protein
MKSLPTPIEIARGVFPDPRLPDDFLEYLIWNETGYPCFWMTDNPYTEMQNQLQDYRNQWDQCLTTEEWL